MAKPVINRFQTYAWDSPQEQLSSCLLTDSNIQMIRNLMVDAIDQKVNSTIDLKDPQRSLQTESFLTGQITAFQLLLDQHDAVIRDLSAPPPQDI